MFTSWQLLYFAIFVDSKVFAKAAGEYLEDRNVEMLCYLFAMTPKKTEDILKHKRSGYRFLLEINKIHTGNIVHLIDGLEIIGLTNRARIIEGIYLSNCGKQEENDAYGKNSSRTAFLSQIFA